MGPAQRHLPIRGARDWSHDSPRHVARLNKTLHLVTCLMTRNYLIIIGLAVTIESNLNFFKKFNSNSMNQVSFSFVHLTITTVKKKIIQKMIKRSPSPVTGGFLIGTLPTWSLAKRVMDRPLSKGGHLAAHIFLSFFFLFKLKDRAHFCRIFFWGDLRTLCESMKVMGEIVRSITLIATVLFPTGSFFSAAKIFKFSHSDGIFFFFFKFWKSSRMNQTANR